VSKIIDTSRDCSARLKALRAAGIETVIRYYARAMSAKVIRRAEALAIAAAGLRLAVVYEGAGDRVSAFSQETGARDAAFARRYGAGEIGQPAGSAVYFAVDFDAGAAQIRDAVMPYFRGVARAFGERNGLPVYRVGVYGSGAVCQAVLDAGLAELAWLSCSSGWRGYQSFLVSGRRHLRQHPPRMIAALEADPNDANPQQGGIGDFVPAAAAAKLQPPSQPVPTGQPTSGLSWLSALLQLLRSLLRR
jgi:hypothetical protein